LKDQKVRCDKDNDTNEAYDPVDAFSCCPTEHEIAHGKSDDADESGNETVFGGAETVGFNIGDEVVVLVEKERGDSDEAGNADCEEAEAGFAEVETVDVGVDKGKCFEEGVVDSVG